MAIRDEQGFELVTYSHVVTSNNTYTIAHGILDTSKVVCVFVFCKGVNTSHIPNGNPSSTSNGAPSNPSGISSASDYWGMLDATNFLINVPLGSTNLDGMTVTFFVKVRP